MKSNASVSGEVVSPCPLCLCGSYHGDTENTESIRLGMPELALRGLSEGWLLRQCGSRHWSAIAKHLHAPPERLEDIHGNRLYPSFLAVRLTGSPLSAFREGDEIHLGTQLTRLSRNRFFSSHRLSTRRPEAALQVEMISALLKRERTQDNTSLREADVWIRETEATPGNDSIQSALPAIDKAIRNQSRNAGESIASAAQSFRYRYRPSPHCDFNGAGLLYFANYHSIVDRAEWEFLVSQRREKIGDSPARPENLTRDAGAERGALGQSPIFPRLPEALEWTTAERDTFFFANLNPGDEVDAVLVLLRTPADTLGHRARLFRVSDRRLMAEVVTKKRGLR